MNQGHRGGVTVGHAGVAIARHAAESLRLLDDDAHQLRPDHADRFLWSADVCATAG